MSSFRRRIMMAMKEAIESVKAWIRSDGWYRSDPW